MGCTAVSVYHDEANGVMGYPQKITTDLYDRNFCAGNMLKNVLTTHPYYVYGFNQNYAQARLFTYVLKNKQYFVYSAGRFLMIMNCSNEEQKAIMHEDKIISMDCKGKLCLVATVGARLILWDLQFFQHKINIKLENIYSITSLSLTDKFIFLTDTQQPKNNIYCYDVRTAKFRAKSEIASYEQTFKGINWGVSQHVTAAGDGVWFCKYSQAQNQFQIIKGMFRIFPKTSMVSLAVVNQTYLVSGSVDGYIFLWAHDQCQKAMKVGDSPLSEIYLHKNKLIVSNFADNVRVFQYTIKKKVKIEQDEQKNGQITDQFVSVIIDSYQKEPLQAVVVSKLEESVYYAQTRSGLLFSKMIPSAQYHKKMQSYKTTNRKIIQFQRDTLKYIYKDDIWLLRYNKPFFQIKRIIAKQGPQTWKVNNRYLSNAKKYSDVQDRPLYCLIPQLKQICYTGINKLYVCQISDIQQNPDLKIDNLKETVILEFQSEGPNALAIRGFTPFEVNQKVYLIIFFGTQYLVLRKDDWKWNNFQSAEYQKEIVKQVDVEGTKINFQQRNNTFRVIFPEITAQMKQKMSFMHCVHQIEEMSKLSNGKILSLGGGYALIK